jgi:hypothetical protein
MLPDESAGKRGFDRTVLGRVAARLLRSETGQFMRSSVFLSDPLTIEAMNSNGLTEKLGQKQCFIFLPQSFCQLSGSWRGPLSAQLRTSTRSRFRPLFLHAVELTERFCNASQPPRHD